MTDLETDRLRTRRRAAVVVLVVGVMLCVTVLTFTRVPRTVVGLDVDASALSFAVSSDPGSGPWPTGGGKPYPCSMSVRAGRRTKSPSLAEKLPAP